jgi:hypothetical protein
MIRPPFIFMLQIYSLCHRNLKSSLLDIPNMVDYGKSSKVGDGNSTLPTGLHRALLGVSLVNTVTHLPFLPYSLASCQFAL